VAEQIRIVFIDVNLRQLPNRDDPGMIGKGYADFVIYSRRNLKSGLIPKLACNKSG